MPGARGAARRRGAHAASTSRLFRGSPARDALGGALAVALVAGLIGLLNLGFGEDPPRGQGPVVLRSPSASASPTPSRSPLPSLLPSPAPSPVPEPTAVSPSAEPFPSTQATPLRAPLRVYNYSRRQRLAARAAAQYEAKGWQVVEVANTDYDTDITTVYFAPGQEAVAAQLRQEFPAIRKALPRPAGLQGDGLTVVVTREYPA